MRVGNANINLFIHNHKLASNAPQILPRMSHPESNINPIKVTISEEAKKAYRERLQGEEQLSYEDTITIRTELLEQKRTPQIHYGFMLSERVAELGIKGNKFFDVKEMGAASLKAYASIYHEITQGYTDGIREIYVEDDNAESGYRKVTKDEEIKGLDDAYQGLVSTLEAVMQQAEKLNPILAKHEAQLAAIAEYKAELAIRGNQAKAVEWHIHEAEMALEKKEMLNKESEQVILKNIASSLLKAKQNFLNLYWKQNSNEMNLKDIVESIKMF